MLFLYNANVLRGMSYAKSVDDNIDQSDEKHQDSDDVIQNIRGFLVVLLIDIQSSNDKEQNADYDLKVMITCWVYFNF